MCPQLIDIRNGPQNNAKRWPGVMHHLFFYTVWIDGAFVPLTWGGNGTRLYYGENASR